MKFLLLHSHTHMQIGKLRVREGAFCYVTLFALLITQYVKRLHDG